MEDIEYKTQEDLKNFRNIPILKKELEQDRQILMSRNENHPLIQEINNVLEGEDEDEEEEEDYNDILCNELFQLNMPVKEMEEFILRRNWKPLLDNTELDCGLNVLSFLNIVPIRKAIAKTTCLNVDTGLTMDAIKDLIIKKYKISYAMTVHRIAFSVENIKNFVFEQLGNESLTIIRTYLSKESIKGRSVILYKLKDRLCLFAPQQQIYAFVAYDGNEFVIRSTTEHTRSYQDMQDYLNKCVSFEFLTTNENIPMITPPSKKMPTFQPLLMSEENPFHMFLLVAHGNAIYEDNHKEPLEFPFHSLGFFVEKGLALMTSSTLHIDTIMSDITTAMTGALPNTYLFDRNNIPASTAKQDSVIVNKTGVIGVNPMYWYVEPQDPDVIRELMGLYHLIYDKEDGIFRIVQKIEGYNFFLDHTTNLPNQKYYGHIIRRFNQYYKDNRTTYFKNIPRELIFMGIWSCRVVNPQYANLPPINQTEPNSVEFEDEPYSANITNLQKYLRNITKKKGGNRKPVFLELVKQEKMFKIIQQRQKEQKAFTLPNESRRRRRRRHSTLTETSRKRKNRKTRKNNKGFGFSIF